MLKRTTALGVSRLLGASLGASTWPHFLPPTSSTIVTFRKVVGVIKTHLASWHLFTKTVAGKIRYCKRLLSHPGQERACTRIIWLFVGHHAKNGPIYRKMVVIVPLVVTSKVRLFFFLDHIRQERGMNGPVSLLHS